MKSKIIHFGTDIPCSQHNPLHNEVLRLSSSNSLNTIEVSVVGVEDV